MKIFAKFYDKKEDIITLINKSEPITDFKFSVLKFKNKYGWASILVKINKLKFLIKYSSCMYDTANLIEYFSELVDLKEEIVLVLDNEGSDPIFYAKPINDDTIRFLFASDYKLFDSFCMDEIDDYNLTDFYIECDILINKKVLLKEFYNIFYSYIKKYEFKRSNYEDFNVQKGKKYLNKIATFLKRNTLWPFGEQ